MPAHSWTSILDSSRHVVVEGLAHYTGRSLLARSACVLARYGAAVHRLGVWSASAADVLAGFALAEQTAAELYLAHRTLTKQQVTAIVARSRIDAVWADGQSFLEPAIPAAPAAEAGAVHLMTSGTTGLPKIARHTLASLTAAIRTTGTSAAARWLLTYPATSFAGLQVMLTSVLGGGTLFAPMDTTPPALVTELRDRGITHASGTPSLWRKLLLATEGKTRIPTLRHITLGGEAVDQPTLDRLALVFPEAQIRHIYASTEAGVIFTVSDHRAGFPASYLDSPPSGVSLRIRKGILEVRSARLMATYVSGHDSPLSPDGWLSTGDAVRQQDGRIVFQGRSDGRFNVGGYKVFPDQVEQVMLAVEGVADARVFAERGPLAGDVLVAEVVPHPLSHPAAIRSRLLGQLRRDLPAFAVPRIIRFTDSLPLSASHKKVRNHAPSATTCRD